MGKALIFSAPSGSGKSTIIAHLLTKFPQLEFSISATSREPRGNEVDGKDYYFLSNESFATHVKNGDFIEYEEVYAGTSYGTLNAEIQRIWSRNNTVVFDVDVVGGLNLKRKLEYAALSVFIMPPSIEELQKRLANRATDSKEDILKRVAKAEVELGYADKYDVVVVNDDLQTALNDAEKIIEDFLKS